MYSACPTTTFHFQQLPQELQEEEDKETLSRRQILNKSSTAFMKLKHERANSDEYSGKQEEQSVREAGLSQNRLVFDQEKGSIKVRDDFAIGTHKKLNERESYSTNKRSTRLIQNADHMQIGTLMYSQEVESGSNETKVSKKFVPMFPFFYDEVGNGRQINGGELYLPKPPAKAIPLTQDKHVLKEISDEETKEDLSGEGIPTKAHLRFATVHDPLFCFEDTRADSPASTFNAKMCKAEYIVELEIANMKSVLIYLETPPSFRQDKNTRSRPVNIKIYIAMHRPCSVQKIYATHEQKPQDVRSPFRHPTDLFLNYWNLHQVFYLGGSSYQDLVDRFEDVVKKRNPLCKIRIIHNQIPSENKNKPGGLDLNDHMQETSVIKSITEMFRRCRTFKAQLPKLRLPLMFSILAMLSADKVNIFNSRLLDLMDFLIAISDCNKSERNALRGSYALDNMISNELLDYKTTPDINFVKIFERYYSEQLLEDQENESKQFYDEDANFMKQRRLMITPTIDYYQVQVEDETCLVIRKYKDHISRFVRVSIVNENFDRGFYQQQLDGGRSLLLGYVHNVIQNGIVIYKASEEEGSLNQGCVLRFLSYSNSQIKRHSAWFFVGPASSVQQNLSMILTENHIIESCGDFSKEKNLLKKYARRGQCFSTAKFVLLLHPSMLLSNLPDIKRNGYCFTDGVGYISPRLAHLISYDHFGLGYACSAFQIRIGGAKGVLMVNPKMSEKQESSSVVVCLRESQIKFASNDLSLNVVRCATYSQGYLNRQLIILLSCLGVPDQVFVELQRRAKEQVQVGEIYKKMMVKSNKVLRAFKKVNARSGKELSELMRLNIGPSKWLQEAMKLALLTGYELQNDPLMSSILYTMQLSQTLSIKKKARILLEDSCVLIGVVDEQGILGPNEVYIQLRKDSGSFSKRQSGHSKKGDHQSKFIDAFRDIMREGDSSHDSSSDKSQILSGKIIVSRNPCTHPGDIRLLKAVGSHPEFDHLVNVVVFPSTGDRPLCNMMSGGDLDGDVYFVTWDATLLQHLTPEKMYPPAKYSKPDIILEKPASETIADYFTFYLERDCLGQLANLHLALADQYGQKGPLSQDCIELSRLQSIAVDFAKHGECVPRDHFQHLLKQLQQWPDFFEKKNKQARESQGILGILYRDLSNEKCYKDFMQNQYKFQVQLQWELDPRIIGKATSHVILHSYLQPVYKDIIVPMQRQIRYLMLMFRQHTEAALFASDLKFSITSGTSDDFVSSLKYFSQPKFGQAPEEALIILNVKLSQMLQKFRTKLSQMISQYLQTDINAELNIAVAIYFATYFHIKNASCKRYLRQIVKNSTQEEQEPLFKFIKAVETHENARAATVKPSTLSKFTPECKSFQVFLDATRRVEETAMINPNRLQRLIEVKRLFSVPWLLVSDVLCDKQDFLKYAIKINQQIQAHQKSFGSAESKEGKSENVPPSAFPPKLTKTQSEINPSSSNILQEQADVEMKSVSSE